MPSEQIHPGFDVDALDTLQASFSSYLGHFRYAACHRLIQSIGAAHPWLKVYFGLRRKTLQLFRRDRLPKPGAVRTVQAQYRYWREAFPDDVILIQVGAFYERLQWPVRRNSLQTVAMYFYP